ncbi:hypothetical protein QJS66_21515 [Kocuria rhizophila]|nr:hypothetical protein QJS66_21515 [Kocuria rhizophila]
MELLHRFLAEEGSPNPNNVLIEMSADTAEYWDARAAARSPRWPT